MLQYLCTIREIKREVPVITSQNIIDYLQRSGVKIIYSDSASDKPFLRATKLSCKAKLDESFTHQIDDKICVVIRHRLPEKELRFLLLHEVGHICLGHNLACIGTEDEDEANSFAKSCLLAYRLPQPKTVIRCICLAVAALCIWVGIAFAHDSTTTVYVTKSGEKYHKASCVYVQKNETATPITLIIAKKRNYEPCAVCFGVAHKI